MVILLESRGASITARDQARCTPLMRAAENEHIGIVKMLIERQRTYILSPNSDLVNAASKGMESAVRTLLSAKILINAVDDTDCTALIRAATNGHENVVRLLLDQGANIEARDLYGATALIMTVAYPPNPYRNPPLGTVRLLIERGANVRAKSNGGFTAIEYATRYNYSEVVDLLSKQMH